MASMIIDKNSSAEKRCTLIIDQECYLGLNMPESTGKFQSVLAALALAITDLYIASYHVFYFQQGSRLVDKLAELFTYLHEYNQWNIATPRFQSIHHGNPDTISIAERIKCSSHLLILHGMASTDHKSLASHALCLAKKSSSFLSIDSRSISYPLKSCLI